ncbi:hypothetical protein [Pseudomonas fluorescens]|uniref:hypothetical protein n=1 Tax=Pseudomonas fluorescens TaxID=294 RepID=UPI003D040CD4
MSFPISDSRIDLSHSNASILINRMVEAVACTDEPAYLVTLDALGDEQVKSTILSMLFDCVPQINEEYANRCDDEHQEVFWAAYQEIGLERSPLGLVCMNSEETCYLSSAQAMNALVDRIRLLISFQELDKVTE